MVARAFGAALLRIPLGVLALLLQGVSEALAYVANELLEVVNLSRQQSRRSQRQAGSKSRLKDSVVRDIEKL